MPRKIPEALGRLEGGLVASCQATARDSTHSSVMMAAMARVVVAAIGAAVPVPIVGPYKVELANSPVRITPRLDLALEIARAGATSPAGPVTGGRRFALHQRHAAMETNLGCDVSEHPGG